MRRAHAARQARIAGATPKTPTRGVVMVLVRTRGGVSQIDDPSTTFIGTFSSAFDAPILR